MRAVLALFVAAFLGKSVVASRNSTNSTSSTNLSSAKVAPKSEKDLQAEVHKLKTENARLRGLLGNTNSTDAAAAQGKNATVVKTMAAPVNQTSAKPAAPVNQTVSVKDVKPGISVNQTVSAKDVKSAVPVNKTVSAKDVKPAAPLKQTPSAKDVKSAAPLNHTASAKALKPAASVAVEVVNHALDNANAMKKTPKVAKNTKNITTAHEAARLKLKAAIKALDRDEADIARLETNTKGPTPAAHVETTDAAKDAALDKEAANVMHLLKNEAKSASNSTRTKRIMRQLVAPPDETMKPIIKTFKDMITKLEKLNKHDGDENRMVFCETIAKDLKSCETPFKDAEGVTYKEHSASECLGVRGPMDAELTTDSTEECQTKCNELGPECAGFLHMTSGRDAGKCYFKKGGIKDIETSDKSTCFEKEDPRDPLVKKFISLNLWVLEQASNEINWICQAGFRSHREENRVEAFRLVVQTYMDGIQCQPGDIPCPGGTLTGEKPMCECIKD